MALIKIEKLPTVRKVQALGPEIEDRLKRLRAACVGWTMAADVSRAESDLFAAKSEDQIHEASARWLSLLSQAPSATRVIQRYSEIEAARRKSEWEASAGLVEAAFNEVESALKDRRKAIEQEDRERSAELGSPYRSNEILQRISDRLEKIEMGRNLIRRGEVYDSKGYLGQAAEVVL